MIFKRKKIIFNIHLILGFLACLPLIIIALSGSMLSYADEIRSALNSTAADIKSPSLYSIPKSIEIFKEQNPNLSIPSISINKSTPNLLNITAKDGKVSQSLLVYDGKIISENIGTKVIGVALMLHRNLGLSLINPNIRNIGKEVVALSTFGLILLCLSGLYLYYPRLKHKFFASLKPNFKLKKYSLFYNFHAVFGTWSLIIVLVMSATGLFWSYQWVNDLFYKAYGVENVKMQRGKKGAQAQFDLSKFNNVLNKFNETTPYTKVNITQIDSNLYQFSYQNDSAIKPMYSLSINANSLEIKKNEITPQRAVSMSVFDLHTGAYFGNIGIFLWCVASFLCALFAITGLVMSYFRLSKKPKTNK